jgi:hypothetical protein
MAMLALTDDTAPPLVAFTVIGPMSSHRTSSVVW